LGAPVSTTTTLTQLLTALALFDRPADIADQTHDRVRGFMTNIGGNIPFVGKVDRRFEHSGHLDKPCSPDRHLRPKPSAKGTDRGLALGLGFGGYQVAKTFDLPEIHPACQKSPPGKLPGVGWSASRLTCQEAQNAPDHSRSTVHLKLRNIFTGEASRRRKPENQTVVNPLAAFRITQCAERCMTRRRQGLTCHPHHD
jgi:hypothetical protein